MTDEINDKLKAIQEKLQLAFPNFHAVRNTIKGLIGNATGNVAVPSYKYVISLHPKVPKNSKDFDLVTGKPIPVGFMRFESSNADKLVDDCQYYIDLIHVEE